MKVTNVKVLVKRREVVRTNTILLSTKKMMRKPIRSVMTVKMMVLIM